MFPEGRAVEFLVVAIVALIVVGPKDLPMLLRKLGQFMAKVRSMAAEFRASFDEMARQSELDELRKEVEAMRQGQLSDIAKHAGGAETAQTFDDISQGLSDFGVQLNSPVTTFDTAAQTSHVEVAAAPKARARKAASKTPAPAKAAAAKKTAAPKTVAAKPAAKAKPAVAKAPATKAPMKKAAAKPAPATSAPAKPAAKPRARKAAAS